MKNMGKEKNDANNAAQNLAAAQAKAEKAPEEVPAAPIEDERMRRSTSPTS